MHTNFTFLVLCISWVYVNISFVASTSQFLGSDVGDDVVTERKFPSQAKYEPFSHKPADKKRTTGGLLPLI